MTNNHLCCLCLKFIDETPKYVLSAKDRNGVDYFKRIHKGCLTRFMEELTPIQFDEVCKMNKYLEN